MLVLRSVTERAQSSTHTAETGRKQITQAASARSADAIICAIELSEATRGADSSGYRQFRFSCSELQNRYDHSRTNQVRSKRNCGAFSSPAANQGRIAARKSRGGLE